MRVPVIVSTLALLACDAMIMDQFVIKPPTQSDQGGPSQVLAHVRETLGNAGLSLQPGLGAETWRWRDPENPPGLSAVITRVAQEEVHVRLSQDLFGPMGETAKYREVKRALRETVRNRFGKDSVRIE